MEQLHLMLGVAGVVHQTDAQTTVFPVWHQSRGPQASRPRCMARRRNAGRKSVDGLEGDARISD